MRTVLLAWELGNGFGHISALRRVASRLGAKGFRRVAAVKHVNSASTLVADGVEVLQAPIWPILFERDACRDTQSSVTMGDTLGDAGLADPKALGALVGAWRTLIDIIRPDLIVGDYAPAAGLAALGRLPLGLIGTGYTMPPDNVPAFPLLHHFTPPRWHESHLLESVNTVRRENALAPLHHLPQLFSGDAKWVHVFPLLDPYAAVRDTPAHGPSAEFIPKPRRPGARDILIYFSTWIGVPEPILRAFTPVAKHTRIFAPYFPRSELEHLAGLGMRIEKTPFNIMEELVGARLVVHVGSAGFACDALFAGVPQMICPTDIEKQLHGDALENAGVGKKFSIFEPDISLTPEAVISVLADQAMADRAQALGENLRAEYAGHDSLSDFEQKCLKLLH